MEEREFARQISRAWTILSATLRLGRFLICQTSLPGDTIFRDVSLDRDTSYDTIFRTGLSRSNYNILLRDYSYFQFSLNNESSWRLCYFPNPWLAGSRSAEIKLLELEYLEEEGALSHEEVCDLLDNMPYIGAIPPIRFECAPSNYREIAHPAAHFHIGRHTENRWACSLALGPTAFALLIAKLYYPDSWSPCSSFYGRPVEDCVDETFVNIMQEVRLIDEFSAKESGSLHFGRTRGATGTKSASSRNKSGGRMR